MSKKLRQLFEEYLTKKISVEIKCCLIFFLILCFYCGYRLLNNCAEANIWHMLQMVLLAYLLGWIQSLVGSDFEEVDSLSKKDWAVVLLGALAYSAAGHYFSWYGQSMAVTAIFFCYMIVAYLCTFLIYKIKRTIDALLLNRDLKQFQHRNETAKE